MRRVIGVVRAFSGRDSQQLLAHRRPLTVLHVAQPTTGGVARVVTDLVRAQTADGIRALVACPSGGELPGAAAGAGAEVLHWAAVREPGRWLVSETAAAARLVRDIRPDLVHAHSAKAGLAVRLAVRGRTPTVFQPHAWSFEAAAGIRAGLALRWERHAARWAARVLCVSEDERRRAERHGVRARWTLIRNGVDTERFRPADAAARSRARELLRGAYGLSVQGPLAVCVGRLCHQKGQDVLLRAWPAVAARVPGAWLALVGDGPADRSLRRLAGPGADAGRVLFPGQTGDPGLWYAAADLVVLPSRWEGMALAPLEAMACGRPVVLSEVDGAAESLPPGHAAVCLVPPEDPDALATAVLRLLTDAPSREALGGQARAYVREACDVRRTTDAVAALYRELLGVPAQAVPERAVSGRAARERAAPGRAAPGQAAHEGLVSR